jgi:hypothetical protein
MKKKYQKNSKVKYYSPVKRYPSKTSYIHTVTTSEDIHLIASIVFGNSYYISHDMLTVL